jgi:hypothetical protein
MTFLKALAFAGRRSPGARSHCCGFGAMRLGSIGVA